MAGRRIPVAAGVTEPKRMERRDPRLPVADMFDPQIARRLWDSLPLECRSDHFNKKTMPDCYRNAVPETNASGGWTSCYLNFRDLPEPMIWEIAWLIHREIEMGRFVSPNTFNSMTRVLRLATSGGTKRGRRAQSLLQLTPEEWMRETHAARMRGGHEQGDSNDHVVKSRIGQLQDVLVYPYHQGPWWGLNVWNPLLDKRIPLREHEPMGTNNASFTRLSSDWLREAAKLWLSANLSTGRYTWSTIKSRLDALKWLQRHIDQRGDEGPCLTADPHALRPFIRGFCDMLATHRIKVGPNTGQLLGKNPRRHVMVAIEQFYQWMYDHRDEAAATLKMPQWAALRPEHCVLFRPEDKPRLTNKRTGDAMVLDDDVMRRIAEGCDVLGRPRSEGGLGDIQGLHALMLLMRTGRRMNEVLMMDFDPLEAFHRPTGGDNADDAQAFVARLRYQQTKIESSTPASIPVDAEIVAIIKAQQAFAKAFMVAAGEPDRTPKYLFLRTTQNRLGANPYPAATLHLHLGELTEALAITDSAGRPVSISQTHRFRHTAATNLLNAGVPLHVVMRYFGHVSPEMTLHYAVTLSQTMEEEFLKYKKVTRDGRTADLDPADLYELLHLDKRADRVLPNGWCTLPPKKQCDKGNACLSCSVFVTDASHTGELQRQLDATDRLVTARQNAFTAKYGSPMGEDNIWLKGRRDEIASLNRILLSITDVTDRAIRGAGVNTQTM